MTDNDPEQEQVRTNTTLPPCACPASAARSSRRPKQRSMAEATLSAHDQATVAALRQGTALLVVLRGPNTGARFLLDADEVSAGRHPKSDIFLDDVTVSRRHASFRREGDVFLVRDVAP